MTRRLVLALLTFTTVVLLVTVVPLGLTVSSRDANDYRTATRTIAQSLAALAGDAFDDRHATIAPPRLASAAGPHADVAVLDLHGAVVTRAGEPPLPPSLVAKARGGRSAVAGARDQVVAAAPVTADGTVRGVVVVARPDEPVEHRIALLWAVLGAVALAALTVSVGLALATARWVGRPLRRLQTTAHRWSEGSLHERANAGVGPPEVREMASALNAMAARLDTLVLASRAVVADVAHQLRTPLAAMRLRLELIGGADDEADRTVALAEVDRLSRLVDGLLAVARAEAADTPKTAVDVAAVVQERQRAWQPVAEERSVSLAVDAPRSAVLASATEGHLEQILDNLIDNSLEAMPGGGRIALAVRRHHEGVEVEVADDGPGMSAEQQDNAFRRFVSSRSDTGSGLGLAVVHRLVTGDGGSVGLECPARGGTVVRVVLPAARTGSGQSNVSVDDVERQGR